MISSLEKEEGCLLLLSSLTSGCLFRQRQPCICKGNGLAMSSLYPEMRFSWEIKSVDALFCNGLTRLSDLSKEAILQAGRICGQKISEK